MLWQDSSLECEAFRVIVLLKFSKNNFQIQHFKKLNEFSNFFFDIKKKIILDSYNSNFRHHLSLISLQTQVLKKSLMKIKQNPF